ncbi:MAG: fatty acid oxidation complex subunit alpha FadB [Pseudohongiellaceae bacterium]
MIYQGKAMTVEQRDDGIAVLTFDLPDASMNVFNRLMLDELGEAATALAASSASGLLVRSAKAHFLAGADIREFREYFRWSEEELLAWAERSNAVFNAIEDLPMPTVTAINGVALGGGLEMALSTDFRVAGESASLGFPEVTLGICPGFGGTVRAPRLMDVETALEWVRTGRPAKAAKALDAGAIDSLAADDMIEEAALELLGQAINGELDYQARRQEKTGPLPLGAEAASALFAAAIERANGESGPHYPAASTALEAMAEAAGLRRGDALKLEHHAFVSLARSVTAGNLVQLFLNDQFLKSKAKKYAAEARPVTRAGVLGAGIMGGGIAYQSALKGVPVQMKDIAQEGLDLGMGEAERQLKRLVGKGKVSEDKAAETLRNIHPVLDYSGFDQVGLVVEAVVENVNVKHKVLAEVEQEMPADAVLTSNTSTISIDRLSEALQRPENFCGMHFFNPVPLMPLVEVIRGGQSSETAVATTVAYAQRIGKTPIVVNNCPGFLINRILFPYFGAFCQLLRDGADFRQIDRVMEAFGWPMGPAYLLDVVGMDTAAHCQGVMSDGFPERMQYDFPLAIDALYEADRLGQKNGRGFYRYQKPEGGGRPEKVYDESILEHLAPLQQPLREFDDDEIRDRLMLAMCLETVRCLEDGIVESAIEADMGLLMGLGFPRFRGGALRYIDNTGVRQFVALAERYQPLGPLFAVPAMLRDMAEQGKTFYE